MHQFLAFTFMNIYKLKINTYICFNANENKYTHLYVTLPRGITFLFFRMYSLHNLFIIIFVNSICTIYEWMVTVFMLWHQFQYFFLFFSFSSCFWLHLHFSLFYSFLKSVWLLSLKYNFEILMITQFMKFSNYIKISLWSHAIMERHSIAYNWIWFWSWS